MPFGVKPDRHVRMVTYLAAASIAMWGVTVAVRAMLLPPAVLYNLTTSLPPGFYRLSADRAALGTIVAFRLPTQGRAYAAAGIPFLLQHPVMKRIAAGDGSTVCAAGDSLMIDGRVAAHIEASDSLGRALPRWAGCRRLRPGEWVVVSNHVPNSFDSRYFGLVTDADILGVYQPLWVQGEGPS